MHEIHQYTSFIYFNRKSKKRYICSFAVQILELYLVSVEECLSFNLNINIFPKIPFICLSKINTSSDYLELLISGVQIKRVLSKTLPYVIKVYQVLFIKMDPGAHKKKIN